MNSLKNKISNFVRVEDGLVTVEWVALTAGMVVAVPALCFHRYFRGRIAAYIVDMEHEAIQLLDTLDPRPASARTAPGGHGIVPPVAPD